jgi:hypothetical protein
LELEGGRGRSSPPAHFRLCSGFEEVVNMQHINGTHHLSNVDDLLRAEIDRLTEGNEELWPSPNRDMRDSVHAIYQYPAMMVPAVQRSLIDVVTNIQPGIKRMVDPFVGAGTTLTAAMHRGLECYGQDINPLAVLLSRVKTGPFFCASLARRTQEAIRAAKADTSRDVEVEFPNIHKWFKQDVAIELSKLKCAIQNDNRLWARRFMWVALAETIRLTCNDRTSTYKLHIRPADEIANRNLSPIEFFSSLVEQNLNDLSKFKRDLEQAGYLRKGRFINRVKVVLGDTAKGIALPEGQANQLYDLFITSPPYGDNISTITYGQHSYLPLQWINLKDIDPAMDESYLRTTQEMDRRSLGGSRARDLEEQIARLSLESGALARTFQALADKPRDRASRVAAFYRDFDIVLDHIVYVLAVNAYMIWTVGNRRVGGIEIPNDQILIELLERRNAQLVMQVERRIHQKRMPHKNQIAQMMSREKILIFRKTAHMEPCGER